MNRKWVGFVVACILGAAAAVWSQVPAAPLPKPLRPYEYKIVVTQATAIDGRGAWAWNDNRFNKNDTGTAESRQAVLNALGAEGWELVSVTEKYPPNPAITYYFRR